MAVRRFPRPDERDRPASLFAYSMTILSSRCGPAILIVKMHV